MSQEVIFIAHGGSALTAAKTPSITNSGVFVAADVATEIENTIPLNTTNGTVVTIKLGTGDTLATLIEKSDTYPNRDEIRRHFAERPAIDLKNGMGMWAPLGRMSLGLHEQNGLDRLIDSEIFHPIFRKAKGTLTSLRIVSAASLSGGSGGGTGNMLSQHIFNVIAEQSDATICMTRLRYGALTFDGLGSNIYPNAGARLLEDIAYTVAENRHPREARELFLQELPILGSKKSYRDRLIAQLIQAQSSSELRQTLDLFPMTNMASKYDSVKIWQPGWWKGLPPEGIIAGAARKYHRDLSETISSLTPNTGICDTIEVRLKHDGEMMSLEDVMQVVENSKGNPDEDKVKGSLDLNGRIYVTVNEKGAMPLDDVLNAPPFPANLDEYTRIMSGTLGLIHRMKQQLEVEKDKREKLGSAKERAKAEVRDDISALYPKVQAKRSSSVWERVKETAKSAKVKRKEKLQREERLRKQGERLRGDLEKYIESIRASVCSQTAIALLEGAIAYAIANLSGYQARLAQFMDVLSDIADTAVPISSDRVVFRSLDDVFERLFRASEGEDRKKLMKELESSVEVVTLAGIAEIIGMEDETGSTALNVVRRLTSQDPPVVAPNWGGKEFPIQNLQMDLIVLPPVDVDTRAELENASQFTGAKQQLATTDSIEAGINILRLKLYRVVGIEDVVTPIYYHAIKEAMKSPELHFLPDQDVSSVMNEVQQYYDRTS